MSDTRKIRILGTVLRANFATTIMDGMEDVSRAKAVPPLPMQSPVIPAVCPKKVRAYTFVYICKYAYEHVNKTYIYAIYSVSRV